LPGVLACADLLLAILEPEAGEFCVPSKVLTYMCVGRPILLAAASNNLASRTLVQYNCGSVVDPSDSAGFVEASVALLSDRSRALEMGAEARRYAEGNFDIEKIASRFESIFHECVGRI
jgi:glycosyltransferase involved in cell wall biosynthesis